MSGQLTVLLLLTAPLFSAGEDEDLLQGLRARRLFHLAETHCQSRLSEQELPLAERTVLTVELIRVYAEQALNAAAANREQAWNKARETAEAFLSEHAAAPNSILVQVQDALTLLARGELARMESEVNANRRPALADARQVLRQATTDLQTIDRQLIDLVPRQDRGPGRAGELSSQQLASLQHNVRFHLARGYRNQALCYDAGSPDRTASLTQALEQLKQPLLQLAPDDPLAVDVRLQQIECLRLLGDVKAGEQYLSSFGTIKLPPDKQLLVRAEAIRLRLAGGESKAALALIAEGRRIASVASPELDFAFLETYASLWKEAADSQDTANRDRWRDKAITTAKFIEQTHGGYWGRRGELLLVRIGQRSGDGSLEILRHTADDLYRKGRLDDAVVAYSKAARAAGPQRRFEFGYKVALVYQQQKSFRRAIEVFRTLALEDKQHPYAANAHLLAIVNYRNAPAEVQDKFGSYVDLLREHLDLWPNSRQTADTAAFWLGEFIKTQKHFNDRDVGSDRVWDLAVEAYRQVSAESPHYEHAMAALGIAWRKKLEMMNPEEVSREVTAATAFFEALIRDEQGDLPGEWSEVQRLAVLAAAEIRLNFAAENQAAENLSGTEQILKSALSGDPLPTPAWRTSASALLLVTIARQGGREAEALEFARQLGNASTDQLLDLFAQIGQTVAAASNSVKPALANLRLEIGKLLEAKLPELNDDQRRSFRVQQAGALANAGRKEEALSAYAQLAKEFPDDGALQEAYASELLDSEDANTLREALNQWRRVAAKSRPRTALWFKAKYSVALAQHKLGDQAGAAKLIRYLQATEDLGQSGLQREFQQLLDRCEK